ncbi:MAG: nucleotide sugar dehydrogenase [Calditrichaceae bacterium]|nr:nucleotide sugar dehydrogenase [Calditrichaceae bacterium]MBN2707460.1 nucleotide sugar dehydrogenase [Calditrichaceae bacterium]RQV94027.1 MAG: nucleotide sugar dehydrogenase [Calditrichota bacterium]
MDLLSKIKENKAVIGVVGLGYVGLPLLMEFVEQGFKTIGFDIDGRKVIKLNAGQSYIKHISEDRVRKVRDSKIFEATTDFKRISEVDCILICVPTPLTKHREPDISYIVNTGKALLQGLRKNQLVVLESSTYPGTTEDELKPILEESGLKGDVDFWVAFSPEREDPNNPKFNTRTIPKVVGANTQYARDLVQALYEKVIVQTVPVSSSQAAEATKLLENIFRSVNIALVNEMKMILDRMGIDVWEVINAASTKPFGYMPFYPGPGLGGHCIPIDPFYLTWKAREYEMNTKFIELAGEINTGMPFWVVNKVIDALNLHKKSINGSKILLLGAAYKKDIDDPRESPSFKLIEIMEEKGAHVDYNDPYVPELPDMRMYDIKKKSVELTAENISAYDCVLISTDHSVYDLDFIVEHAKLVVDTRNATKEVLKNRNKIVKA